MIQKKEMNRSNLNVETCNGMLTLINLVLLIGNYLTKELIPSVIGNHLISLFTMKKPVFVRLILNILNLAVSSLLKGT